MRWTLLPGAVALSFALLSSEAVLADTTYISDKIPVELYSASFQRGVLVTTLESGAIVEITETDGDYSKIRTLDGKEGWVKSSYLSEEKPVRSSYLQLVAKYKEQQDEMEQLKTQLKNSTDADKEKTANDRLRKDLAQSKNTIAGLEKQLKEKTAAFGDIEKQLESLKNQPSVKPEPAKTTLETAPESSSQTPAEAPATPALPQTGQGFNLDYPIAVKWTLAASLLCILVGSYMGYSWLDSKIRRRHGGVRIR